MSERIEWVKNHQGLIAKVAQDPITFLSEWEAADEPWQFLLPVMSTISVSLVVTKTLQPAYRYRCDLLRSYRSSQVYANVRPQQDLLMLLPVINLRMHMQVVAEHAAPNCPESIRPSYGQEDCQTCGHDYPLQC